MTPVKKLLCLFLCLLAFNMIVKAQSQSSISVLLAELNKAKDMPERINILERLGLTYQRQNAHKKAIEYFEQVYQLQEQNNESNSAKIAILNAIGNSQIALKDYNNAQKTYDKILRLQKKENRKKDEVNTLHKLAEICEAADKNQDALNYTLECLQLNKELGDEMAVADTHNNLGFLYRQLGNTQKSMDHFMEALAIYGKLSRLRPQQQLTMYTNLGVTYSYIGKFDDAGEYFQKAYKLAENQKNEYEVANLSNYLAANNYVSGKSKVAIAQAEKAISIAQNLPNGDNILEVSYNILAQIYQKEKDFAQYQKYNKLYQDTREKIRQREALNQQKLLEEQINVEKKENELKQDIAEKEKQEMTVKQLALEKEKARQEADLARKESEISRTRALNQELERKRIEQALLITKQQAEAEKQRQENELLQREKELQAIKIDAQEKEKVLKEKELAEVREKEKVAKQQKEAAEKEARANELINQLLMIIIALAIIGLAYSIYTYIRIRKQKNAIERQAKEIEKQSKEIQEQSLAIQEQSNQIAAQNEELRQNQEEIMAQRDAIAEKNAILAEQNEKIEKSINAAMTIQQAVLPHEDKMKALLGEYFLIFRPRDVVSGDFYWVEQVDNKVIVATVDCTGHGVPGALMSIIGSTMLTKVVKQYQITEPAEILKKLDEEIRSTLQQDKTENQYGMDLSVCVLEKQPDGFTKLTYAGAKRPLYYIEAGHDQVFMLKGDRRSIGGFQNENVPFTNQELRLKSGSLLYLGSDGFTDQNNAERIKLGEAKFKYLLSQNCNLTMSEQQKHLENFLDMYQRGTMQRDDILLMGIKV
jgi:serine phosphatase RsbU (regulator of sigma subunit)